MTSEAVLIGNNSHIVIESGLLSRIAEHFNVKRKVLIVTDDGVPAEYAQKAASQCPDARIVTLPQGEKTKNFDQFKHLLSVMLNASFSRNDCVIAVGGGVVGDLSGFAAACYMRGIDFYNIPTTLLSQLDSSVGGKTAIDFEGVKNIVGAFHPPVKVLIDPDVLATLDDRQLAAGMVEAIKIAAVRDAELFDMIAALPSLRCDLTEIIRRGVKNKFDVVEDDLKEKGVRRILNFGHTVGHAIEASYDGKLLHGECVALGMLPMASAEAAFLITALLEKFGLQTKVPLDIAEIKRFLAHDKKADGSSIKAVLCNEIGSYVIKDMTGDEIIANVEALV